MWAKSKILATCLLYMVDLVVFALLVASDLPFWLFTQVTDAPDLCALPHRVLHGLGKGQTCLPHPFVQASVDWTPKDSRSLHEGTDAGVSVRKWHTAIKGGVCTYILHNERRTPLCPPVHSNETGSPLQYLQGLMSTNYWDFSSIKSV